MTRDEAIKLLECSATELVGTMMQTDEQTAVNQLQRYVDAYDMAIAALREQDSNANQHVSNTSNALGGWISVEERLPERDKSVLILCKNKAMFTGYQYPDYEGKSRWRIHTALSSTKLLNRGRVTHWMPLPEPIKEEV